MKSFSVALAIVASFATAHSNPPGDDGDDDDSCSTITSPSVSLPTAPACATVTSTRELCSTCVVPACLEISTITKSCACPEPVPTVYLDFPCSNGCQDLWCETSYAVVTMGGCATATDVPSTSTVEPSGTDSTSTVGPSSVPSTSAGGPSDAPSTFTSTVGPSTVETTSTVGSSSVGSSSSSATSSVATGAAGRMRTPFRLW